MEGLTFKMTKEPSKRMNRKGNIKVVNFSPLAKSISNKKRGRMS
jgi:hypothetical protein